MKLIVVRHGQTDYNARRIMQGQLDTDLNTEGQRQARALAAVLAEERIDYVYSSDLKRARLTTAAIMDHHHGVPLIYSEQLRERHFGPWQDQPASLWYEHLNTIAEPEHFSPEGGESLLVLHARMASFWKMIRERHAMDTVLISSHGGVTRSLITHVLDQPLSFRGTVRQDNCCLNIFEGPVDVCLDALCINNVAHLSVATANERHA